ncbi:hypothetical protein KY290_017951 [Solanum tuberosum]|uniref:Pentatricopeptide repeat-containing protein n=1 Tax=Solanum tuberosum TaxID=4113 RepID=A0ABQ7VDL3_SOLTU|nr:hypothetical protein KY284_016911 [Solanum tuberosum]KAH0689756.1 hypothetical protein KY289_017114 [Solanum tuberosum]KAH0761878.1 hypothetical protein KY290_017951 [Solanum tuberosum]
MLGISLAWGLNCLKANLVYAWDCLMKMRICGTKEVAATEEKHGNEIEFCSLFSNKVTRSMGFYGKAAFFSSVKFPRLFTIRSL